MNSLSWLIYLAGVLGNLQTMLIMLGVFICICVVASVIFVNLERDGGGWWTPKTRWPVTAAALLVVSSILPSKDTMYAIAASEIGGKIAQTEMAQDTANDAMLALRAWLKKQQEPTK